MSWVSQMLPTCQDMSRLLSDAMDRTLPFHMRVRMHLHLLMCVLCGRYRRQLRLIRDAVRKKHVTERPIDDESPNVPRLSPEAKERIQRALDSRRS